MHSDFTLVTEYNSTYNFTLKLLDENSTVHDQDMKNDSEIKILLKKKGKDTHEVL
jgi:hypothetical protein